MEFDVKSGNPEKQRTACLVAAVFDSRRLSPVAETIDEVSDGYLSSLLRRGDIEGRIGQTLLLHNVPGTLADRVLLVGCGKERELGDKQYREIITNAVKTLNDTGSMEAVCYLTEIPVRGREIDWKIRQAVQSAENTVYRFEQLKSKKDSERRPLRKLVLTVSSRRELGEGERAVAEGLAISNGERLAKDLGNMPGNICTPSYLADEARAIAEHFKDKITCEVLEESDMETLGMGALLSVSRGSRQPAKLIILHYKGGKPKDKPIVLVGKGLTFDAGGISLKPAQAMDEMKYDMCGGASVMGALQAAAELALPINVIAIVPASENMPDGNANKPGDIVTSMSGLTIEILNTDAEGRLILCDALTYAERFDPEIVIDVATLTGACVVALGSHASGLLGNHSPLVNDLLGAGKSSGDRAWELPLWDEYQEQLKSEFADIANIGGKEAGAVTGACFLSRFTKKYNWAHLDIAGTAWKSNKNKSATGRPVPLLTQFLIDFCTTQKQ